MASKEKETIVLAIEYYGSIDGQRRRAYDTNDELEPKRRRAPDFWKAFLFLNNAGMKRIWTMVMLHSFVVVAVFYEYIH